ncbi:MAG: hypothetical protein QM635_10925 [Microbacteriaceae bacterium]
MTALPNPARRQRADLVAMPRRALAQFPGDIQRYGCTFPFIAPPILDSTIVAIATHRPVIALDSSTAVIQWVSTG